MYNIYQRNISDPFYGDGNETVIVQEDGIIVGHTHGWNDPSVVDDWKPTLIGQPAQGNVTGWQKLRGFALENSQGWARDAIG